QAAGQPDRVTQASDIYSLGATLYCLLTGRSPVEGTSIEEVLYKASQGLFPRPRDVNRSIAPALEAICLKAMARQPEARYASPSALADEIEHWLADEPVSAWREPWRLRVRRWLRRHRTLATTVMASTV